ncbi:hypothetical protein F2Q70_00023084 [Brassica cretica]|uniref:Uncharacterized protein n=1 Tax=Brassica cretica TaxID=69181 RepID=A0A8S9GT27_BRACR|nr:hypothetical protein F2Q70_00023084 [Brassica cretica]
MGEVPSTAGEIQTPPQLNLTLSRMGSAEIPQVRPSSSSSSPSPDRANHGSLPGAGGGGESAQPKVSALGNGAAAAAARPWNLRTRRAACEL